MPTYSPESSTPRSSAPVVVLRDLAPTDRAPLERILRATAVFAEHEIAVALELIDADRALGYRFFVAEVDARDASMRATGEDSRVTHRADASLSARRTREVAGYACFGATPCTDGTYDLYWIAVDPALHGHGVGRALLSAVTHSIRAEGGRQVLIETASKPSYEPTRRFYLAAGGHEVARVPDFYARGDDKVIYALAIDSGTPAGKP